ncbi:hypothetical protein [Methyloglobulus sp.]|uniref:hypothetical protein n=1 Tax=Methyloglobulus sp. TaxID=2518622 RepID=UPI0032B78B4D
MNVIENKNLVDQTIGFVKTYPWLIVMMLTAVFAICYISTSTTNLQSGAVCPPPNDPCNNPLKYKTWLGCRRCP